MTEEEIEAVKKQVEETKRRNEELRKVARETSSRSKAREALDALEAEVAARGAHPSRSNQSLRMSHDSFDG